MKIKNYDKFYWYIFCKSDRWLGILKLPQHDHFCCLKNLKKYLSSY